MADFATGARAATGPQLRDAQRQRGLQMLAPVGRPQGGGGVWQLPRLPESSELRTWAEAQSLTELQVDACGAPAGLTALAGMERLVTLRLGGLSGIVDLRWLPALPRLRALRLEGFGDTLASLDGIGAAPALEALALDPRGGRATVESLAPLAALGELRLLVLPAVVALDPSLSPLAALRKLELFHGTAYFGPDEYATLADSLPGLRCPWFSDEAWRLL